MYVGSDSACIQKQPLQPFSTSHARMHSCAGVCIPVLRLALCLIHRLLGGGRKVVGPCGSVVCAPLAQVLLAKVCRRGVGGSGACARCAGVGALGCLLLVSAALLLDALLRVEGRDGSRSRATGQVLLITQCNATGAVRACCSRQEAVAACAAYNLNKPGAQSQMPASVPSVSILP